MVTTQFEEYPTEVYFPSGRADIRFYINGPNEGGRDPGVEAYLICEKKVGSKAVLAWTLSLKKVDNNDYILPPVMKDKGAILLMLHRRRLRPIWKGKNVKMIGDEMVKAKELAGYRMMSNHFDTLWYFFVDRYGNASIPEEADFARFDFPGSTEPYPISSQEKSELKD